MTHWTAESYRTVSTEHTYVLSLLSVLHVDFPWTCSGRVDCIHFMTLTNLLNNFIIIIIVYIFLETVLYTFFISTILNGNYIIIFGV